MKTEREAEPKSPQASPRNQAKNWLARREHSLAELRLKLTARHFSPEEVETTVTNLAQEGLVSDDRFAEAFIIARVQKGQGPLRIRIELEQRGVSNELIESALDRHGVDWNTLALSVREKKFGAACVTDYRDRARQARFLQYRGFTGEQIQNALGLERD